jgi:hypothetical protein
MHDQESLCRVAQCKKTTIAGAANCSDTFSSIEGKDFLKICILKMLA